MLCCVRSPSSIRSLIMVIMLCLSVTTIGNGLAKYMWRQGISTDGGRKVYADTQQERHPGTQTDILDCFSKWTYRDVNMSHKTLQGCDEGICDDAKSSRIMVIILFLTAQIITTRPRTFKKHGAWTYAIATEQVQTILTSS